MDDLRLALGTAFGVNDPQSLWTGIATLPIFFWELSVGLYMIFKGSRRMRRSWQMRRVAQRRRPSSPRGVRPDRPRPIH